MSKKWRLAYAGIDSATFALLCSDERIEMAAAARWDAVFRTTLNPVNWMFQIAYSLRVKNSHRWLETLAASLFESLAFCASGHWKRHRSCLRLLTKLRVKLLDFTESAQTARTLKSAVVDLLVISVWDVLPAEIIKAAKFGTINVHPSKLPQYRGALPTLWTLKNKDDETAVTYFTAGDSVDAGRILGQHPVKISKQETWLSLEEKIQDVVSQTLAATIAGYLSSRTSECEQNDAVASWTGKYEDYRLIMPSQECAEDVFNKINYYPHWDPGTYCHIATARRKIAFKGCRSFNKKASNQILSPQDDSLRVCGVYCRCQCRDGSVSSILFIDHPVGDSFFLIRKYVLRRVGELALGHTANWLTGYAFDLLLYPFVIWKLGLLRGGVVMALLSLLVCLGLLLFYDWSKRDWLGIEAIKQLRDAKSDSAFLRVLSWTLSRSDWLACALLSIKFDPFITTAWMRRGAFNGMNARDWRIFSLSWLIGNCWWALACFGGVQAVSHLWHWFFP